MSETRVAYRIPYEIDGHAFEIDAALGTRGRVRAVAQFAFKDLGYPIDQITQTLVYRVLRQGSLTTISDELRSWREDVSGQLRHSDLPAPLLDAALSLWRSARDQADRELEAKRLGYAAEVDQLKDAVNEAKASEEAAKAELARQLTKCEELQSLIGHLRTDLVTAHDTIRLERERASEERREHAQRLVALESALSAQQNEAALLRASLEQDAQKYHAELAALKAQADAEADTWIQRFDRERQSKEALVSKYEAWREEQAAKLADEKAKARDLAAQVSVLEVKLSGEARRAVSLEGELARRDALLLDVQERARTLEEAALEKDRQIRVQAEQISALVFRPAEKTIKRKPRRTKITGDSLTVAEDEWDKPQNCGD